jgi:hypothetical protein
MRKTLPLLLTCVGLLSFASQAGAAVNFTGATPDAAAVYFTDDERLVSADTDSLVDVYSRSGGVTTLVSVPGVGASGTPVAASFSGASSDGTKVFFTTSENLVAADTDGLTDIYERSGGTTTLVSAPGIGSSGAAASVQFKRVSSDGSKVFFETSENLVTADTDGLSDAYERSGGATTLISVEGVGSSGPLKSIQLVRISSDGSKAFLITDENFTGADTDGLSDTFERSGGTTSLVTAPGVGATGPAAIPTFNGTSSDGSKAFFTTTENMVAADTDGLNDIYERSGGTTTLVSEAGAGATPPADNASLAGFTADGSKVYFETQESLVGADTDGLTDAYERSSGTTTLVTVPGTGAAPPASDAFFLGTSSDGSIVFFDTDERMEAADTDADFDSYKRTAGTTTLVTPEGAGASGPISSANYETNSADGSIYIFQTDQNMVGADTDGLQDLYQNVAGVTTLLTAPGTGATGPAASMNFRAASTDGSRLIFQTVERLTGADGDTTLDIYERSAGTTTLLSGEAGPPLGSPPDTTISSGPPSSTQATAAAFSFTSDESPATFECRMDGGAFTGCGSPFTASGIAVGAHTFEVRSTDFAGNVDPSPASLVFTVVAPPAVTPTPAPKHCKKGQKLKKGKCVKKKRKHG